MNTNQKILIVGGVAGGASAAARLRRLDESANIIMFEKDFVKTKTSKLIAQQGSDLIGNEISVSPSTSL